MKKLNKAFAIPLAAAVAAMAFFPATALAQGAIKIGFVTFLSGPAAAPFGVPAKR